MSNLTTLLERNRDFARDFSAADLPIVPKMRTVLLTCVDARVDPAHVLGLALGEAVVIRNNGARVTPQVVEEIATLAFMVAKMDGDTPGPFEIIIMQHTQCGAERFADPGFQLAIRQHIGVDVSSSAIADHQLSLQEDIQRLRDAAVIPRYVVASGFIYDVHDGLARQVVPPVALAD